MRAAWVVKAVALLAVFSVAFFNCASTAKTSSASGNLVSGPDVQSGGDDLGPVGPLRLSYRSGDFGTLERQFEELNASGVHDSVKCYAYYIMGQMSLKRDDYQEALRFFAMVPDKHPDYLFARHAAAIACAMSDDERCTMDNLGLVIEGKPKNNAQKEIINRSYVFLGFLYYENLSIENALARAVTALRKVPKESVHYQDALLGLGWTALKSRQWGDCVKIGEELAKVADDSLFRSEGNLLHAYALAMQKNYTRSVALLDEALQRVSSYTGPSDEELAANRGNEYEYKGQIFFSRDIEQFKDDAEIARARFARFAVVSGARNSAPKSSNVDEDEIEKLRKMFEEAE
ncbi:MAG: hypothetical protein LBC59_00665 [Chitinispirillales bacterium]|nr:hypothetical protein [Chitinispirillales bacterium]